MSVVIPSKIQSLEKVIPSGVSGGGGVYEAKANMGISITSLVDGVKGDAELVYRTGKVNLTPADLGIPDDLISDPDYVHTDNNFTDADKATLDSIDETYATKSEIPRNTSDLVNDSNYVADASYVHTDQNFTSALKSRLESVENGAEVNVIESVKRNGTALPVVGKAVDVSVPTATSELTNDAGFLTAELDPTVPAWAKQATKPAYTASEVGALPNTGESILDGTNSILNLKSASATNSPILRFQRGTLTDNYNDWQIQDRGGFLYFDQRGSGSTAFNEMVHFDTSGNVYATGFKGYLDWGYVSNKPTIPSATSQLTNDSGYIVGSDVPANEQDPSVPAWAKASSKPTYTASEVGALPDTTAIPSKTSDLQNDSGYIDASAIPTNVSSFANDVPYAVANADGASLQAMAIPFGRVDSTSTSTVFTATVEGISTLKTGVCVMLSNHVVTSASGFTINVNGLGAKPCYSNMTNATRETTIFNVNYTMLFVYDESLDGGDGGWWVYRGYNSDNNTIGYIIRSNSLQLPVDSVCYRYRLLFTAMDGQHYIPANNSTSTNATAKRNTTQTPFDPFGGIIYYGYTTVLSAGGKPATAYQFEQQTLSLGYSFNRVGVALTLTEDKPVWLKCTPQSDGSVVLDAEIPFVQDLPTTEDGFVYIWLGVAYSATNIELTLQHPVKWYKDGAIRNWWG